MLKYISLLFITGCSLQNIQVNHTEYNETSPAIAVLSDSGNGYCGGTWIDENKILTALHCVEDTPNEVYATNYFIKTRGSVIVMDHLLDLAIVKTDFKNKYWAATGHPSVGESLTVIMPPGKKVNVKVVKEDKLWGGVQVDWLAPNGASGSPAYNDKGEVVCIITKRIPEVGGFCNTFQNFKIN
jgi:hypothetical protein